MHLAERMARLGTETAFEVLARARELERQGHDVIHLEIGEPDFDTPTNIVEAGIRALRDGATHYTPPAGVDPLRRAIAQDQSARKAIDVSPQNVVVTPGGKPIMFFVMLALLEEGDEVVYPNPGFPIYESMVDFLGAKRVPIGFIEEGSSFRWDVDAAVARIGSKTKLVILNSPSNPVGCTISEEEMRRISDAAVQNDVIVLSDEIYSRIVYGATFVSPATFPEMLERTCILDGFSKTYAMTGWRLGYGILPSDLASQVARLMTNSNSCTATFSQLAAVEALTGPQDAVKDMVAEFRRRRDMVVPALNAIRGVNCPMPQGAFYAFPDIRGTGMSSREAADALLYDANVAVLAGTAFGINGEGYLRLSFANSYDNLERALERMRVVLERKASIPAG
jgi:aspartate/methionine/tyrosine aminotransferase